MKVIFLIFVVICIFSKVTSEAFRCYECDGDDCNSKATMKLSVCHDPDEPKTTMLTESSDVGTTEVTTSTTFNTTTEATTANTLIIAEVPTTTTNNTETTIIQESAATPISVTPTTMTNVASSTLQVATTILEVSTTTSTAVSSTRPVLTQETTANTTSPAMKTGPSPDASPSPSALLLRGYRSISRLQRSADHGYACYTIKYKDGDDSDVKIKKGCIYIDETKSGCEAVEDKLEDKKIEDCKVCKNSECNSAAAIKLSILSAIIFILTSFIL